MSLDKQIANLYQLIRMNTNQKTLNMYCKQLVMFMEKRKTLTTGIVSAS